MKRLIMVAVFLLTIESALGQVVIDQVMYDPIGSESGGEFVLLKNNGGTVDISGWIIMTSSSPADVVIPDGVMLFPGSTYLIADNNWNVSKDDSTWPEADLESTMTMKNSDSGVALVVNGTVIDAVGWGVSTNPLLFEGSPTSGTVPGESLQRINDTEDNAVDFVTGVPVFGVEAQGDISVVVTVLDANVTITNGLMLEDDDASAGIQITPSPGAIRDLPLEITLESNRNVTVQAFFDTESGMLELVNSSDRTKVFSGSVGLPYSTPPGLHNITITGDDGQDVAVYRVEFEVLPLVALDVSVSEINFGSVLAGSSVQVSGDTDMATPAPTIENLGNVGLDVGYIGTPLHSGMHMINASAMSLTLDEFNTVRPLDISLGTFTNALGLKEASAVGFELIVPEDAVGGTYQGFITLSGVRS